MWMIVQWSGAGGSIIGVYGAGVYTELQGWVYGVHGCSEQYRKGQHNDVYWITGRLSTLQIIKVDFSKV